MAITNRTCGQAWTNQFARGGGIAQIALAQPQTGAASRAEPPPTARAGSAPGALESARGTKEPRRALRTVGPGPFGLTLTHGSG